MKIACLHTAEVHVATFDLLFAAFPDTRVTHVVRPDLLADARSNGLAAVTPNVREALDALADADAVLCTCSTLGPLVGDGPRQVRIDLPAVQVAVAKGPDILVAICLDSTRQATLDLLHDVAAKAGRVVTPRLVLCDAAWPYFEAGDMAAFAESIAATIQTEVAKNGPAACILLAQASMSAAAPLIGDGTPVLTTPELAVQAAVDMARR